MKFSIGEDERPLLLAEIPVAPSTATRSGSRWRASSPSPDRLHDESRPLAQGRAAGPPTRRPPERRDGPGVRLSPATRRSWPSSWSRRRVEPATRGRARRSRTQPAGRDREPARRRRRAWRSRRLASRCSSPSSSPGSRRPSGSSPRAVGRTRRGHGPHARHRRDLHRPAARTAGSSSSVAITARNRTAARRRPTSSLRPRVPRRPAGRRPGSGSPARQGATVGVAKRPRRTRRLLRIDFGRRLYSGKAADLPAHVQPAGDGQGREPAGPGRERAGHAAGLGVRVQRRAAAARRTVRFPAGWDVAVESGSFDEPRPDARRRHAALDRAAGAAAHLLRLRLRASARRSTRRRRSTVPVGDRAGRSSSSGLDATTPHGPSGSASCSTRALPVLGTRDRRSRGRTTSRSSSRRRSAATPAATPGCSTPPSKRIEVAYWAERRRRRSTRRPTRWFNGALVADRWASEGFARCTRSAPRDEAQGRDTTPEAHRAALRKAAIPLDAWPNAVDAQGGADRGDGAYGYAASYALARAARRAGRAARPSPRVWAAAAARRRRLPAADAGGDRRGGATRRRVDGPPGLARAARPARGRDRRAPSPTCGASGSSTPDEAATARRTRAAPAPSYARTLAPRRRLGAAARASATRCGPGTSTTAERQHGRRPDRAGPARRPRGARRPRRASTLPDDVRPRSRRATSPRRVARAEAERNAMLVVDRGGRRRAPTDADPLSRIGMLGEDPEADLAAAASRVRRGRPGRRAVAAADDALPRLDGAWAGGPPPRAARARAPRHGARARRRGDRRHAAIAPPPAPDEAHRRREADQASTVARPPRPPRPCADPASPSRPAARRGRSPPAPRSCRPRRRVAAPRRPSAPRARRSRRRTTSTSRRRPATSSTPATRRVRVTVDVTASTASPTRCRAAGRHPLLLRRRQPRRPARGDAPPGDPGRPAGRHQLKARELRDGYRLTIRVPRRHLLQETARVRLPFDLPAGEPRSDSDVRVGPAFATFLAWAFGDAGRSGSRSRRASTSTSAGERHRSPGRPRHRPGAHRPRPTTPSAGTRWSTRPQRRRRSRATA